MRKRCLVLFAVLAFALVPLYASAEIKEGSFELDPFIGGIMHDGGENVHSAILLGGRAGYNFTPNLGLKPHWPFRART